MTTTIDIVAEYHCASLALDAAYELAYKNGQIGEIVAIANSRVALAESFYAIGESAQRLTAEFPDLAKPTDPFAGLTALAEALGLKTK